MAKSSNNNNSKNVGEILYKMYREYVANNSSCSSISVDNVKVELYTSSNDDYIEAILSDSTHHDVSANILLALIKKAKQYNKPIIIEGFPEYCYTLVVFEVDKHGEVTVVVDKEDEITRTWNLLIYAYNKIPVLRVISREWRETKNEH